MRAARMQERGGPDKGRECECLCLSCRFSSKVCADETMRVGRCGGSIPRTWFKRFGVRLMCGAGRGLAWASC